jgi:hypothetical protein
LHGPEPTELAEVWLVDDALPVEPDALVVDS